MQKQRETFDHVVVGAGLFGTYAALRLAQANLKVLLIDHDRRPWRKASIVNQARLHYGYHYPRSIGTARLANGHRQRFERDHAPFINREFTKYYAIDQFGSLTSADQFERFCAFLDIKCQLARRPDLFKSDRIEALFETVEYSFDPFLMRRHYQEELLASAVTTSYGTNIVSAEASGSCWTILLRSDTDGDFEVEASDVLNAAYANVNAVNDAFGLAPIEAEYEISEVAIAKIDALAGIGLTVMDGPYMSVMPYGCSSYHSLTSVPYTHHAVSKALHPEFSCQKANRSCLPTRLQACTSCAARPDSNINRMISQMGLYLNDGLLRYLHGSLYTVKTKLRSSHVDDARPTDIRKLRQSPGFSYVFSGKINSIYEVEQLIDDL